ncbi:hypothetical protein HPB51_024337 [Rhipicephalus microplus]|uniref:Uncharacterized protein n=1 Tax=Rhipicephalus microplus TaxID=6941 RepID=A0A9J6EEC4_RHIMP|nr:hypothetical protein HPB51_024337 [Rhipicephalus microplus]
MSIRAYRAYRPTEKEQRRSDGDRGSGDGDGRERSRAVQLSATVSTGSDKAQQPEDKREEPPEPAKGEEVSTAITTSITERRSSRSSLQLQRRKQRQQRHQQRHEQRQPQQEKKPEKTQLPVGYNLLATLVNFVALFLLEDPANRAPQRSKVAIIVDGTSNAQRHGSSQDVLPHPPQQETPASLAMRIAAALIVVLIVINVLVFAYASIMSSAEPPLRQLTDPPGGNPIYDIPARVFNVTVTSGDAENRTWDNVTQG